MTENNSDKIVNRHNWANDGINELVNKCLDSNVAIQMNQCNEKNGFLKFEFLNKRKKKWITENKSREIINRRN